MPDRHLPRRDFLKASAAAAGLVASLGSGIGALSAADSAETKNSVAKKRRYNPVYEGPTLNRVAFPLGGIGAGGLCLEGTGTLTSVAVRNRPDFFHEPCVFAALSIRGSNPVARVIEGPVPGWKLYGAKESTQGQGGSTYGLPRFHQVKFSARFPFGTVSLADPGVPLTVELTGWSPFIPGDADNASLPVAGLDYRFTNPTDQTVEGVFSFNAANFMAIDSNRARGVRAIDGGFELWSGSSPEKPWEAGSFAVTVSEPTAKVNHVWFRGSWFDPLTMAWKDVAAAACYDRPPVTEGEPSPGATIFVPVRLAPGASQTIPVRLSWHVGKTNLNRAAQGEPNGWNSDPTKPFYQSWYAGKFSDITAITNYWATHYDELREQTARFTDAFYDSTLPAEVIEAVAANLVILKSPTVLRQADGRFWAWEGSQDQEGSCPGSCTHVWNYAQAVSHLFPSLERTLRETEFGPDQNEHGHQQFRAALPIRPIGDHFHAAADGQLGGIMKIHRDWRISGDTDWLRGLWPKIRLSLDYCIENWDPKHKGWLEEPHHNTYDIEFWGPDGMCTSIYLGALQAGILMGKALNEETAAYQNLLDQGRTRIENELFNGEYFFQKIQWKNLRAANPQEFKSMQGEYSSEALALLQKEGPKYQYGTGCLSDGVLGAWLALVCGVGQVIDAAKVTSHLRAVHRYNLKTDLSAHVNPQRPSFATGSDGGLLICTWPNGGALSLPFVYSNEVWTGIEYQVASHLMLMGLVEEGLEIVRTCRDRYDGRIRNPFNEYECGHWYARAMSSYGLLQGLSGASYDAVDQVLHLRPSIAGDFRSFLSTATGYGTVGVKDGQPFLQVRSGEIKVKSIDYRAKV